MRLTQKLAIGATSLGGLAIGSLGLGIAHAQIVTPTTPSISAPAPEVADAGGVDAPGGANVQSGDQLGPDTTAAETPETGAKVDAPGGPDVQSGAQSGPNTGGPDTGANK